jgi:hypothetical protein
MLDRGGPIFGAEENLDGDDGDRGHDALKDAGASEDKARAAAVAMEMHEPRFSALDSRLTLLTLMVGFNLDLTMAIVGKVFLH